MRVEAEVVEAHGQRPHHQPLSSDAVHCNAPGGVDRGEKSVERCRVGRGKRRHDLLGSLPCPGTDRSQLRAHFTAPSVSPRAMYLCTMMPPMMTGAQTSVAPAITFGQGTI